jgi:hypothetical protein
MKFFEYQQSGSLVLTVGGHYVPMGKGVLQLP